jgi:hypothetical protein
MTRIADQVSADRIQRAARGEPNPVVVGRELGGEACLSMPAASAEEKTAEDRRAARYATRCIMLAVHGCAAARRRQSPEGQFLDLVLRALGLAADPVTPAIPRKRKYGEAIPR